MQQAAADVLIALGSDRHTGLSGREAESRLEREGPNEVPENFGGNADIAGIRLRGR